VSRRNFVMSSTDRLIITEIHSLDYHTITTSAIVIMIIFFFTKKIVANMHTDVIHFIIPHIIIYICVGNIIGI